jgi:hypothetical protein
MRTSFRLSRRDISQRTNHITESGKGLVDSVTFFESIARGTGLSGLLGPSQIDQVDFRLHHKWRLAGNRILSDFHELDSDDRMGTRRSGIHLSFSNSSIPVTLVHKILNLFVVGNWDNFSIGNGCFASKLSDFKVLLSFVRLVH